MYEFYILFIRKSGNERKRDIKRSAPIEEKAFL